MEVSSGVYVSPILQKQISSDNKSTTVSFGETIDSFKKSQLSANLELDDTTNCLIGEINNKDAFIKRILKFNDKKSFLLFSEGLIGDKKISISGIQESGGTGVWQGVYGDEEIDLKVEKLPTYSKKSPDRVITGKIGNKDINISIPGSKVPTDSATRDILMLILDMRIVRPEVYNDTFVGIDYTKDYHEVTDAYKAEQKEKISSAIRPVIENITSILSTSLITTLLVKIGLNK